MDEEWVLTQEALDKLLAWLDPDRERAGRRYQEIHSRLVEIFISRGWIAAEELADATMDRVARKLPELAQAHTGDPALCCYGVAYNIHREELRRTSAFSPPPRPPPAEIELESEIERECECLEQCMARLSPQNRALVLQYYQEDKQAKIDYRKELAARLGIGLNALRIRAHRIRTDLHRCVQNCLDRT